MPDIEATPSAPGSKAKGVPPAKTSSIVVYDRDNFVKFVNEIGAVFAKAKADTGVSESASESFDRAMPLASREGRKAFLKKFGIDAGTPNDFRVVLYQDQAQTVLFKAKANEKGTVTLTDGMVLSDGGTVIDAKGIKTLMEGSFKPLPQPIVLPAPAAIGGELNLTPDQKMKLQADVTLLVLAEKAMGGAVTSTGSNAGLPYQKDRSSDRTI